MESFEVMREPRGQCTCFRGLRQVHRQC
jgi:hypothetical protein